MKEALSEKELTQEESLQLIARMIGKARADYFDTGISALLWGAVITVCSLVGFANQYLEWPWLDWIWMLTFAAVIPQIVISIQEKKARKHKAYEEDLIGGIWLSFGIAIFLWSWFQGRFHYEHGIEVSLILYGMPTFSTGYARRFKPMIFGGIACWIFSILSTFTDWPYRLLYLAAGAQLAWFIPGLILRKSYLKAKRRHV